MPYPSKFFSLLRTLNPSELQGFQKFIQRYHAGETVTLKVFSHCKRFHAPDTEVDNLDLASIHLKVFKTAMGKAPNDRKKILNPLSDLHLWLKEYLLLEEMRSESWNSKMVWLNILQERGLYREFSSVATELYQAQTEKPLSDIVDCFQQIAAGLYYKRHLVQHQAMPDFQAMIDCAATIKQGADIISLKTACEILNDQKIRAQTDASPSTPAVQPLMSTYQMLYALLSGNREEDYPGIVSFLQEHLELLSETEVLTITRMLHNFAAPRVRSLQPIKWSKQVHALDIILLKKGLYTQKGVMSATSFCNIVNAACIAQEMDWARQFIAENTGALPENARSETIDLSNAIIAFEEKNFNLVLTLLENPQLKHMQHVTRAKTLKLRALYELNPDDDAIEPLYTSFEKYLKHHRKEQPALMEATLAFVVLFRALHQKKLKKPMLLQKIETTPRLYFRQWLLEKAKSRKY